jgi:hypothetical protein
MEESGESDRLDFAGGTTSHRPRSTSDHLGSVRNTATLYVAKTAPIPGLDPASAQR